MHEVNAREARSRLSELLTEAEHGEVITITRRGREVARLVPPGAAAGKGFPDMVGFRKSIKVKGRPTSKLISDMRDRARW